MRPITLLVPASVPAELGDRRALLQETLQLAVASQVTLVALPPALFAQVLDGTRDAVAWAPPLVARELVASGMATTLAVADAGREYTATLVARADIESLVDVADRRVGWVSKLSATGYRIPRAYLESFGLDLSSFFASERFYGTHRAVTRALVEGEIDVAATHSGRLLDVVGPGRPGRVLTSIGPVPGDVIVASVGLAPDARDAIARALLSSTVGPFGFRFPRPGHLDLFDLLSGEGPPSSRARLPAESGVMLC